MTIEKNQVKTITERGAQAGAWVTETVTRSFPQYSSMEGKEAHDKNSRATLLPTFLYNLPLKCPLS